MSASPKELAATQPENEETPPLAPLAGVEASESLADYLVQGDEESDAHFDQRATLAEAVSAFLSPSEAVMVARLLQNKYNDGVIYPAELEEILATVLRKLA